MANEAVTSNQCDVTKLLAFVKQSGFSKRYRFYRTLQERVATKLDDPSVMPAWPDALNLVNDEDWATAYHDAFGDVALPLVESGHETSVDPARWLLAYLDRLGGLGHDKHELIRAVLKGSAYVRDDRMYTDGSAQKAGGDPRSTAEIYAHAHQKSYWVHNCRNEGWSCTTCGSFTVDQSAIPDIERDCTKRCALNG